MFVICLLIVGRLFETSRLTSQRRLDTPGVICYRFSIVDDIGTCIITEKMILRVLKNCEKSLPSMWLSRLPGRGLFPTQTTPHTTGTIFRVSKPHSLKNHENEKKRAAKCSRAVRSIVEDPGYEITIIKKTRSKHLGIFGIGWYKWYWMVFNGLGWH